MVKIIAGYKKNKPLGAECASNVPPRRKTIEKYSEQGKILRVGLLPTWRRLFDTGPWTKVLDFQAYETGSAIKYLRPEAMDCRNTSPAGIPGYLPALSTRFINMVANIDRGSVICRLSRTAGWMQFGCPAAPPALRDTNK